jgi:uncharacterized protein
VIGTDCPVLTAEHLRVAADTLRASNDAVLFPAEDGGYVLIGAREPLPGLFDAMPWGTAEVAAETRRRLAQARRRWHEPLMLWDVDEPADLARLRETGLADLVPAPLQG